METDIRILKEEVSALEAWIRQREEYLRLALTRQTDLLRVLAARSLPPDELAAECRKVATIREELNSLREPQQLLEAKKDLLYRLESRAKYQEATPGH